MEGNEGFRSSGRVLEKTNWTALPKLPFFMVHILIGRASVFSISSMVENPLDESTAGSGFRLDKQHAVPIDPAAAQVDSEPAVGVLGVKSYAGAFAEFLQVVVGPGFSQVGGDEKAAVVGGSGGAVGGDNKIVFDDHVGRLVAGIVQHGVQLRSSPVIQEAIEHLRKGTIGKVYMARGLVFRWRPSIGNKPDIAAPDHLDWNLWQGPAAERKFSERIVHYNWHWHWAYGNGDVGNQGVNETDLCLWGLDVKLPSKITAMGGKFLWEDDKETPEVLSTNYFYPEENKMIQFEVRHWNTNKEDGAGVGNIFYASEGYMVVKGCSSYQIFLGRKGKLGPKNSGGDPVPDR